jgi:acetamidase/formamidase
MAQHELRISEESVRDHYSSSFEPALRIVSGNIVTAATLDVGWGIALPPDRHSPLPMHPFSRCAQRHGPPLHGPIYIEDAEPGDVLEVHVLEVRPGTWGWTRSGGRDVELDRRLGVSSEVRQLLQWKIDPDGGTATSQLGHRVHVRPFLGMMGVCPGEGIFDAWTPRSSGGNLDCKELGPGAVLHLPVSVRGALFSMGDGHASQGNGEVCGQAIECGMERVELQFFVNKSLKLPSLMARTAEGWITFGFGESLDNAMYQALNYMLDFMVSTCGIGQRADALALASAAVDLRVTQIANPLFGVHAVLPHGSIRIQTAAGQTIN